MSRCRRRNQAYQVS